MKLKLELRIILRQSQHSIKRPSSWQCTSSLVGSTQWRKDLTSTIPLHFYLLPCNFIAKGGSNFLFHLFLESYHGKKVRRSKFVKWEELMSVFVNNLREHLPVERLCSSFSSFVEVVNDSMLLSMPPLGRVSGAIWALFILRRWSWPWKLLMLCMTTGFVGAGLALSLQYAIRKKSQNQ